MLHNEQSSENNDDVTVHLSGKYKLTATYAVLHSMRQGNRMYVNWHSDVQGIKNNDDRYCLNCQLVAFVQSKLDRIDSSKFDNGYHLEGYTRIITKTHCGNKILLYAQPLYQGREWYDWVYVHFEEINASGDTIDNYYPARILGFVTLNNITEAVVHCSEKPTNWTDLEDNFIVQIKLGPSADISIVSVPLSSLVHPLCAIPDYGFDKSSFIIVLPKHNCSRYFGNKISE